IPGDFKGHALPGSFLIFLSLWWNSVNILKYVCKKQKQTYLHFKPWIYRAELLDGIILIGMVLFGTISLQIYAEVSQNQEIWILRLHHTVIYLFYGLLGVTRILGTTIKSLPVSLTNLALSNTFFVQTFIMYNHTHGRVSVDIFLHKILALATFLSGLVSLMVVLTKNNITLEMLRSSLIMLQGTWLWQMGFVLYNPTGGFEWDLTDGYYNTMLLSIYFTGHCAFAYIIIGVNYAIITCFLHFPALCHLTVTLDDILMRTRDPEAIFPCVITENAQWMDHSRSQWNHKEDLIPKYRNFQNPLNSTCAFEPSTLPLR
ncbi:hypothetical protein STEG23_031837, partial [Scotinomys teguina]